MQNHTFWGSLHVLKTLKYACLTLGVIAYFKTRVMTCFMCFQMAFLFKITPLGEIAYFDENVLVNMFLK